MLRFHGLFTVGVIMVRADSAFRTQASFMRFGISGEAANHANAVRIGVDFAAVIQPQPAGMSAAVKKVSVRVPRISEPGMILPGFFVFPYIPIWYNGCRGNNRYTPRAGSRSCRSLHARHRPVCFPLQKQRSSRQDDSYRRRTPFFQLVKDFECPRPHQPAFDWLHFSLKFLSRAAAVHSVSIKR